MNQRLASAAIRTSQTVECGRLTVIKPGDAFGGCDHTNPSYFAPGYYRVWAQYTGDAAFWNKLADDSLTLLLSYQSKMTGDRQGLVREWGDGSGNPQDNDYGYNACRTPWRVAVDYAWHATAAAKTFLEAVPASSSSFDKNSAFLGAFALTNVTATQPEMNDAVSSWLNNDPLYDDAYFQATLRVLYFLVAAGKFPSTL